MIDWKALALALLLPTAAFAGDPVTGEDAVYLMHGGRTVGAHVERTTYGERSYRILHSFILRKGRMHYCAAMVDETDAPEFKMVQCFEYSPN